ncbi:hypothetical protein X801_09393 [Opisthorchis viverrini]|uniref:Uncharacterized protein n=1 Tax=Opisthorchis viverrini TaxID=6198 RepID=A0A1S8WKG9_OPIVI|nr:hypothetical protein X801_09393 [Opisthorchis viverrini]
MNGSIAMEAPQTRVPDLERIRNARNKRKLQLKDWHQYDRKMMREAEKLQRKGLSPPSERGFHRAGHSVKFPPSLIFLEAAARGDLDEGEARVPGFITACVITWLGFLAIVGKTLKACNNKRNGTVSKRTVDDVPAGLCSTYVDL